MDNDPNQLRRLRAALDVARFHQRIATGGCVAAAMFFAVARSEAVQGTAGAVVLAWIAPVVAVVAFIPFLLTKCPQCRKRFNSFASFFRSAENPRPCASCGFNINAHLPRYGRPGQ